MNQCVIIQKSHLKLTKINESLQIKESQKIKNKQKIYGHSLPRGLEKQRTPSPLPGRVYLFLSTPFIVYTIIIV